MTLRSRRKRPITLQNTYRGIRARRALAGLLASAGLLSGTALAGAESAVPVVGPVSNETTISPLEALRSRSPLERWQKLRERWKQSAAPAPVVEPAEEVPFIPLPAPPAVHSVSAQQDELLLQPEPAPMPELPEAPLPGEDLQPLRQEGGLQPLPDFPDMPRSENGPGPFAPDAELEEERMPTPRDLKRITDIQPFYNYEPDPEIRAADPCANLCPRREDCPEVEGQPPLCPDEVALSDEIYPGRLMPESVFAYTATNLYYNPLYYEDPQLERYGHTYHHLIQPFDSVGLFSLQLLGLPYQMTIDPAWKKMYPLGYYRPGEPAPKLHYQVPWNTRAAINQAAVTTGMFFLIP